MAKIYTPFWFLVNTVCGHSFVSVSARVPRSVKCPSDSYSTHHAGSQSESHSPSCAVYGFHALSSTYPLPPSHAPRTTAASRSCRVPAQTQTPSGRHKTPFQIRSLPLRLFGLSDLYTCVRVVFGVAVHRLISLLGFPQAAVFLVMED